MKNVTVSLDEATLAEARVRAARAGKSLSRYMSDLVAEDVNRLVPSPVQTGRMSQKDALEQLLSGPKWSILREGRMPTADERNER